MLISFIQKPKYRKRRDLPHHLKEEKRKILFECFEILLSTQKGERPKEKRDGDNKQYFLTVDDNS